MKVKKSCLLLLVAVFVGGVGSVQANDLANKLGIGFNFGGQKLYSDLHDTKFGPTFNVLVNYGLSPRFSFIFSIGYGLFKESGAYHKGILYSKYSAITTKIIPFELKGVYKLMTAGRVHPFLSAGLGVFTFKVNQEPFYWDGSLIGGGGVEFMVQEQWGLTLGADYRFTTGDDMDATHTKYSKAKDNYLTGVFGLTYYFKKPKIEEKWEFPTKIIAARERKNIWDKLGIGFNVGGQKLYSDIHDTKIGPAFNIIANYRFTPRFSLEFSAGYGRFKESGAYHKGVLYSDYANITTKIIPFELKGIYKLLSAGRFHPFLAAGLGALPFKVNQEPFNWEGSFIGGGGIEYMVQEQWGLTLGADFRFTTSDRLDATHTSYSKSKDNYLTATVGLTYYFAKPVEKELKRRPGVVPEIIAGKKTPQKPQAKGDIFLRLIALKSKIDKLQKQIQQKDKEIKELKVLTAEKAKEIEKLNRHLTTYGGLQIPSQRPLTRTEYKRRYRAALSMFNSRQYEQAIVIFKQLLASNPEHELASNCYYWIGESYNGLGRYSDAIAAFRKVFNYRRSYKKDDALLMQGVCYLKQGNRAKAKEFFTRLIDRYPNSEYVLKAKRYLRRLSATEISMK